MFLLRPPPFENNSNNPINNDNLYFILDENNKIIAEY